MRYLVELYLWVVKRLPHKFSIPLISFWILYTIFAFPYLVHKIDLMDDRLKVWLGRHAFDNQVIKIIFAVFAPPLLSLAILLAALLGVFLGYWIAVFIYSRTRNRFVKGLQIHEPVLPVLITEQEEKRSHRLKKFKSIGIILAGGGAKGAYQAGAMKAIYEFLETHKAHHQVRMIAGTSIGSWNALFWLANLITPPKGTPTGVLEQWWSKVEAQSVISPGFYIPARKNSLLSNTPWQESFDDIFKNNPQIQERLLHHIQYPDHKDALHFYFTRANVGRGHLEFTTNWPEVIEVKASLPTAERLRAIRRERHKLATKIDDIREAVFSSMDIPPLFPYIHIGDQFYEDGGVIDNLPIRFGTEVEECDLLFVLPLNANFEEEVNMRSITRRLFRVMNVRQGVLERHSFKMIYLYNELAGLRQQAKQNARSAQKYHKAVEQLHQQLEALGQSEDQAIERMKEIINELHRQQERASKPNTLMEKSYELAARQANKREHKMVQVFSICPTPKLLINTAEFWKTEAAGHAFRLMYNATLNELESFDFDNADPSWIEMAQVSQHGTVTYLSDF